MRPVIACWFYACHCTGWQLLVKPIHFYPRHCMSNIRMVFIPCLNLSCHNHLTATGLRLSPVPILAPCRLQQSNSDIAATSESCGAFYQSTLRLSESWQEPSRRLHVLTILVAKPLHQILLLDPCSSDKEADGNARSQKEKPVRSNQTPANDSHCTCQIKRMSDVAVRASRNERVILPRNNCVGEVLSQMVKSVATTFLTIKVQYVTS